MVQVIQVSNINPTTISTDSEIFKHSIQDSSLLNTISKWEGIKEFALPPDIAKLEHIDEENDSDEDPWYSYMNNKRECKSMSMSWDSQNLLVHLPKCTLIGKLKIIKFQLLLFGRKKKTWHDKTKTHRDIWTRTDI